MAKKKVTKSFEEMSKDELELLSYKDITYMILSENKNANLNTASLFKMITSKLELSGSAFEKQIGDYYTMLSTDKRFLLLADGNWDLRDRHTSDKVIKTTSSDDIEDEEEEEEEDTTAFDDDKEDKKDDFDDDDDEDNYDDDDDDDYKDLVVVDEEELELEE